MTQNESLRKSVAGYLAPVSRAQALYTNPEDVANDPRLTKQDKKQILASWTSDARAVENAPALRRLDSGAVVEFDDIMRALASLDETAFRTQTASPLPRRRGAVKDWLRRQTPWRGVKDDDDDPPPAPTGFGVPYRPVFTVSQAPGGTTVHPLYAAA